MIGARRNKPKTLAVPIVAMANANGGVIMKAEKHPEGSEAVTCIKTLHAKKSAIYPRIGATL